MNKVKVGVLVGELALGAFIGYASFPVYCGALKIERKEKKASKKDKKSKKKKGKVVKDIPESEVA